MQVAMCVILAGTLGLAQLVVYERNHTSIELSQTTDFGPFEVRLPQGWRVEQFTDYEGPVLESHDPEGWRQLRIRLRAVTGSAQPPQQDEEDGGDISTEKIQFRGLGRAGELAVIRRALRIRGELVNQEWLLARVPLTATQELEIALVQGGSRVDRGLIQKIANGITESRHAASSTGAALVPLRVALKNPEDSFRVQQFGSTLVIAISSPGGSGTATLTAGSSWPRRIIVELGHYEHLDRLRISNGRLSLHVDPGAGQPQSLWRTNADDEPVRIEPLEPRYTAPIEPTPQGMEIHIPPALHAGKVRELTIHWSAAEEP